MNEHFFTAYSPNDQTVASGRLVTFLGLGAFTVYPREITRESGGL